MSSRAEELEIQCRMRVKTLRHAQGKRMIVLRCGLKMIQILAVLLLALLPVMACAGAEESTRPLRVVT